MRLVTLIILGIPNNIRIDGLDALLVKLQCIVARINEPPITPEQVLVFFPKDHIQKKQGENIVIEISGLWVSNQHIPEKHNKIAEAIMATLRPFIKQNLKQCKSVVISVIPYNKSTCVELAVN